VHQVKSAKTSDRFAAFVQDQLSDLDDLVMKRMFGGTGLYLDGVFFGIIYGDHLYFRVSEETIAEYKKRKMKPFSPFKKRGTEHGYYEVPLEILESPDDLVKWAHAAQKTPPLTSRKRAARRAR